MFFACKLPNPKIGNLNDVVALNPWIDQLVFFGLAFIFVSLFLSLMSPSNVAFFLKSIIWGNGLFLFSNCSEPLRMYSLSSTE